MLHASYDTQIRPSCPRFAKTLHEIPWSICSTIIRKLETILMLRGGLHGNFGARQAKGMDSLIFPLYGIWAFRCFLTDSVFRQFAPKEDKEVDVPEEVEAVWKVVAVWKDIHGVTGESENWTQSRVILLTILVLGCPCSLVCRKRCCSHGWIRLTPRSDWSCAHCRVTLPSTIHGFLQI